MTDMQPRKPSVWMWIVVALISVPMLYVLSFGPACWLAPSGTIPMPPGAVPHHFAPGRGPYVGCAPRMYWPIGFVWRHSPYRVARLIQWYANALRPQGIWIPLSSDGRAWWGYNSDGGFGIGS